MNVPQIDGILLAAGESRRMGFPKPLLRIGDLTFLERSLHAMLEVAARVIVVTGAYRARIEAIIPPSHRIVMIHNPDYQGGQLSSLQRGLRGVSADAEAALVHLADHPLVIPSTFRVVAETFLHSQAKIVIARYQGRRGHPVLFTRAVFAELLEAPIDRGARLVVDVNPARVSYVEVDDPGVVLDLDTPLDLARAGLNAPPES